MEMVSFPCVAWSKTDSSPKEVLKDFLDTRPSQRWLMVGHHAAHCDAQLWTAWHCSVRRFLRNTQLARTIDAEFIRFIAGTHHISEAFQRAGVSSSDLDGWLIYLPEISPNESTEDGISPDQEYLQFFEKTSFEILESLNLKVSDSSLKHDLDNATKLGMNTDGLVMENFEDSLIGFILSTEFNT